MKPTKHDRVEYILLDPSCSGSGIVNRNDHLTSVGTTKVCMLLLVDYNEMCHRSQLRKDSSHSLPSSTKSCAML